jgi:hypothetical protein
LALGTPDLRRLSQSYGGWLDSNNDGSIERAEYDFVRNSTSPGGHGLTAVRLAADGSPASVALFYKLGKQALCFLVGLDAEFGVESFFHFFEMLLNGCRLALSGERFHCQPMHVLAKRIACQSFARVPQRIGPMFLREGEFCESGNDTRGLF